MPLMGSLYIGASGLQTSQNALNTTAHNLSNVDTEGYVRQQVSQSTRNYVTLSKSDSAVAYQQYGLGTSYSTVKHVRDYFLDKTYRKESGRESFYEVSTNVLEEVESELGELNGEAFQTSITDFWTAIQELAKDPCSSVNQGLLVQEASELIERAGAVYDGLSDYQDNLNAQIKQQVEKINDYGNQILSLNDQIRSIESGDTEHANDLRDTRDQLLDELGELVNITYDEDVDGNVSVQIEGVDFVKGSMCYEIGLDEDEVTGFYTPFWPQNASYVDNEDGTRTYNIENAKVFKLDIEISSDMGTDIGGLKGMLLARGDHRADYTDIEEDYDSVSQSIIMNVQAEFDQLMHNLTTTINDILADAAGATTVNGDETVASVTLSDGTVLDGDTKYWLADSDGYLRAEDGSPLQLFTKKTTDGYRKETATITYADGTTATEDLWLYNEEDPDTSESLYSLSNLTVNQELKQSPSNLGFRLADGSEDNDTVTALKEAFSAEDWTLNPNVKKKTSFVDYYSDLVSQIANSGSVYRSIYENQQTTVESAESARSQVTGVSSDEELSNMIKFQNAYNASSRYINAISEMLEHIINTLGA